jgi:hypothetical protein
MYQDKDPLFSRSGMGLMSNESTQAATLRIKIRLKTQAVSRSPRNQSQLYAIALTVRKETLQFRECMLIGVVLTTLGSFHGIG